MSLTHSNPTFTMWCTYTPTLSIQCTYTATFFKQSLRTPRTSFTRCISILRVVYVHPEHLVQHMCRRWKSLEAVSTAKRPSRVVSRHPKHLLVMPVSTADSLHSFSNFFARKETAASPVSFNKCPSIHEGIHTPWHPTSTTYLSPHNIHFSLINRRKNYSLSSLYISLLTITNGENHCIYAHRRDASFSFFVEKRHRQQRGPLITPLAFHSAKESSKKMYISSLHLCKLLLLLLLIFNFSHRNKLLLL